MASCLAGWTFSSLYSATATQEHKPVKRRAGECAATISGGKCSDSKASTPTNTDRSHARPAQSLPSLAGADAAMERHEKELTGLVEYLTIIKRLVEKQDTETFDKMHIVVGNDVCDLDSAVSTLVYAFHLWKLNENARICVVPLLNIPKSDYDSKTEVKFALAEQGIDQTTLLFTDSGVDPVRLCNLGKLILTLVDHHVPVGVFAGCAAAIVEVIDHHVVDENSQTRYLRNVKLTIEPVGSCATLIAEKLMDHQDLRSLSPMTAALLYETIVLDTFNFSSTFHKATPKDSRVVDQLSSLFTNRFTREEIFERLLSAKGDLSGLTIELVLRKDRKTVEGVLGKVAICSIPVLCQDFFDTEEKQDALEKLTVDQHLKGVVVLGATFHDVSKRDILLFAADESFLSEMVVRLCTPHPNISLELYRDYTFQPHDARFQHFRQGNMAASRKHILPLLANLLGPTVQSPQSPLSSGRNPLSSGRNSSQIGTLLEHPEERQVPALSPIDFGITNDFSVDENENSTHRPHVGKRYYDLDEGSPRYGDGVASADLPLGGKRSPSPFHAQIDNLKSEHDRMVEDAENGSAGQNIQDSLTFLRQKRLAAATPTAGSDVVDGNPSSLMANHEAGNDETRPIMTAAPIGFASDDKPSPSHTEDTKDAKDTTASTQLGNLSTLGQTNEDTMADRNVTSPLLDSWKTDPATENGISLSDEQGVMLNTGPGQSDGGSVRWSAPKQLQLKFSARPTDYTLLENGQSPTDTAEPTVPSPKERSKTTSSKQGPAPGGDTVDGLVPRPQTPKDRPETQIGSTKSATVEETSSSSVNPSSAQSGEGEAADGLANLSSAYTKAAHTDSGATQHHGDTQTGTEGFQKEDSSKTAEAAALLPADLTPSTNNENVPNISTSSTSSTSLTAPEKDNTSMQSPLTQSSQPKTLEWETFESIANRGQHSTANRGQHNAAVDRTRTAALSDRNETSSLSTIAPDIPRSESVEKQKITARGREGNGAGIDEVDTGPFSQRTLEKGSGAADKETSLSNGEQEGQPPRPASPTPDSAVPDWNTSAVPSSVAGMGKGAGKGGDHRDQVEASGEKVQLTAPGQKEDETASLFMQTWDKEMNRRKMVDEEKMDRQSAGYPWDLSPIESSPVNEETSHDIGEAGNLDTDSLVVEEKKVDDSQTVSTFPSGGSEEIHKVTGHESDKGDTVDGVPSANDSKTQPTSLPSHNEKDPSTQTEPSTHLPPHSRETTMPKALDTTGVFLEETVEAHGITPTSPKDDGELVWVKSTKYAIVSALPEDSEKQGSMDTQPDRAAVSASDQTLTPPSVAPPTTQTTTPSTSSSKQQNVTADSLTKTTSPGTDETDHGTGRPLKPTQKTEKPEKTSATVTATTTETFHSGVSHVADPDQIGQRQEGDKPVVADDSMPSGSKTDRVGSTPKDLAESSKDSFGSVTEQTTTGVAEQKKKTTGNAKMEHPTGSEKITEPSVLSDITSLQTRSLQEKHQTGDSYVQTPHNPHEAAKETEKSAGSSNYGSIKPTGRREPNSADPSTPSTLSTLTPSEKRLELFHQARAQNQTNQANEANEVKSGASKGQDQVDSAGVTPLSLRVNELNEQSPQEGKLRRQKVSLTEENGVKESVSKVNKDSTSFDGDCDSTLSSPTDLTNLPATPLPTATPPPTTNELTGKPNIAGLPVPDQEAIWAIDMPAMEQYKKVLEVHMDESDVSRGATVCFFACYLPPRSVPKYEYLMQNFFRYFMSTLDLLTDHQCTLVYFNGAVPAAIYPSTSWLHQCYRMIDRRMEKNLQEVLIVHPNFWLKAQLQTIGRAFLSGSFYNKIRYVDSLESLRSLLAMSEEDFNRLDIPACITEQETKWNTKGVKEAAASGGRFAMLRKCSF